MREGLLGPSSFWWPNCFILNKDYGRRAGIQTANSRPSVVEALPPGTSLRHHHYLRTLLFSSQSFSVCELHLLHPFHYNHFSLQIIGDMIKSVSHSNISLPMPYYWSSSYFLNFHAAQCQSVIWCCSKPAFHYSKSSRKDGSERKQNTERQITQCDAVWCWGLI